MLHILAACIITFNYFVIFYFAAVNIIYTGLLCIALFVVLKQIRRMKYAPHKNLRTSVEAPPVSVIIPAFNERSVVIRTVEFALALKYPNFTVIVVNDGSNDESLQALIKAYLLEPIDSPIAPILKTKPIRGIYYSPLIPNLYVIDKERGGKADALNCGINASHDPYFCSIDADTIIEPDALLRLMSAVIQSPVPVIACGGVVRVVNGSTLKETHIEKIELPRSSLAVFQIVEYLRSFLFGRVGLDFLNATLIISGAFSLFSKRAVLDIHGFSTDNVAEDMDLVVRLHKHFVLAKKPYAVKFITDPICWTQVPESIRMLARQRRRWHLGLIQTTARNKSMLLNPKYGRLGLLVMPYYVLLEMISPLIEILGYITIPFAYFLGLINFDFLILFLIFALLCGSFLSVAGVLMEEMTFHRYPKWRHLFTLVLYGVMENFGYRQCNSFWRAQAFYKYFMGKHKWEVVKKKKHHASEKVGP